MAPGTVIPELAYADVRAAATWLCAAFGFAERLRIGNHRVQLTIGSGSVVVVEKREQGACSCATMVRVVAIDEHARIAEQNGAKIVRRPETYPFGERQYTAQDPGGHRWTFSESVADVHPSEWDGELVVKERADA
jgi:uncharacterized glyoxalase superfamily protein PhnB